MVNYEAEVAVGRTNGTWDTVKTIVSMDSPPRSEDVEVFLVLTDAEDLVRQAVSEQEDFAFVYGIRYARMEE